MKTYLGSGIMMNRMREMLKYMSLRLISLVNIQSQMLVMSNHSKARAVNQLRIKILFYKMVKMKLNKWPKFLKKL